MGGLHFGNLAKVRHIITYSLSPFEQKAFPSYFSKGIPNVWRRFRAQVLKVGPPFLLAYITYSWGTQEHSNLKRKDLSLYENDQ
ncbi:cytochrome b-c1 complex subunit 8 isoform 1-T2 [Discoglossus pictus]